MLTTLKNAFKIKEIRKKLFFTFMMLVVIRFGSQLPFRASTGASLRTGFHSRPETLLISSMLLREVRS